MSDEVTTVVEDLNQLRRSVSAFSEQNLHKRILPMDLRNVNWDNLLLALLVGFEYFAYAPGVCND